MRFLIPSFDTVVEIHTIIIETYGGLPGIPHPELLDAALHRPENYTQFSKSYDIHLVAAIILDSIARNHAFADGNKRTALITTLMVYNLNSVSKLDYTLHMNDKFEELVLHVTQKHPSIETTRMRLAELIEDFSSQ